MIDYWLPGSFAEDCDGNVWFCGDLGWYPMPLDDESWPIDNVPGGIARFIDRPRVFRE